MPTDTDEKPETLNPADADWNRKTALKLRNLESTSGSDDPSVKRSKEAMGDPGVDPEERRRAVDRLDSEGDAGSLYRKSSKESSGTGSLLAKLGAGSKRYGASGGILGLILGLFGLGSVLLAPASLLTNFSTIVNNHTDMGNRLFTKTSTSYVASFLKGQERNCETSKIKCKFATISERQKQKWEARGVKVISNPSVIPGRVKVRGLEFPTGTKVRTLGEYKNLRYTDAVANSLLKRFPLRASYLNTKSSISKSLTKFGTSLSNKFRSSSDKDKAERKKANAQSMNSKTGAITDADGKITTESVKQKVDSKTKTYTTAAKEKLSSAKSTTAAASSFVQTAVAACMAYDVIRATQAAIMITWHADLIKFSLRFLQAGAQAKEAGVNGDFDWETVEYYGDRLTAPITQQDIDEDTTDNITQDMLGKTAMDSKGFAAALNGDPVLNQNYSGWAPISAVIGSEVIGKIQNLIPGGKESIRTGCMVANYTAYLSLALCIAPPAAVKCLLTAGGQLIAAELLRDKIVQKISDVLAGPAIDIITRANLSDSLKGPALGDAIVSGAGVMASYMDRSSGFAVAGDSGKALQAYYETVGDQDYLKTKYADNIDRARNNQFDPTNNLSFAGQLAAHIARIPYDGSLFSILSNINHTVGALPLFAKASALKQGVFQPIEVYQSPDKFNGALNQCKSPGLTDASIPCLGESGRTVPVLMSPVKECMDDESNNNSSRLCIEDAIDYLKKKEYTDDDNNKHPYIDGKTGAPSEWEKYNKGKIDYKNPFLMFMRHCGDDREFPMGYTDQPLDGDNPDWYDGINCTTSTKLDKTDLAWMSYYYNTCIAIYASEDDTNYCWEDSTASLAANVSSGPWVCPVDTAKNGVQTQKPHDIWNGTASGVDYSYSGYSGPANAPIFAVRDGVVKTVGPARGYGYWIVVEHEENGKKISSYYGHLVPGDILVKPGQAVKAGDHIANISAGKVGSSTGPHLHIGLKFDIGQPTAQDYESRFMAKC